MARTYKLGVVRRAINVVITGLLRVGVPAPQRHSWLLTTTGRHTGRARTTPVNLVVDGDLRWLVSPYGDVGWVHNLRADPSATLRRGRRRQSVTTRELGPEEAGPILQRYIKQVAITIPYFDAKRSAPVEHFAAEAARHPAFEVHEAQSVR